METKTIRKLSIGNIEIIFPTILSIVLGVYLYTNVKFDFAQTISIAFFVISTVGLTFIICQLLTKVIVDNVGINQVFLGKKKKIEFDQVKTFEIYELNRFGSKKLNKTDIYSLNINVRSERIILVSTAVNKKPNPWWKKDSNTISIPFRHNIFNLIETKMKE